MYSSRQRYHGLSRYGWISSPARLLGHAFVAQLYEDMPLLVPVGESLGNSWDCAEYWYMSPEDLQRKALVEKELVRAALWHACAP